MKVLVGVSRIFVGIFFIISGFIKLNDPLGFSYKLVDYFAADVLNLEFLQPYALGLAVVIVVLEIMLGLLLIIAYQVQSTLILLLGMIVFFTFLTFYSAYFDKVKDCGCFGDAMKITPWQSFWKDVFLTTLIVIITLGRKYLKPFFSKFSNVIISFIGFIACLGYGYYVLMHLPMIDFRAYKIGANIEEGMSVPEGAAPAVFDYIWKFKENGEEKLITTSGDYPKTTGDFIGVTTEVVSEGYEPPIHDFSIEKDGEDYTSEMLGKEKLVIIVGYNLSKSEEQGFENVSTFVKKAKSSGYTVIGMSASGKEGIDKVVTKYNLPIDFYFCDETALKTIIRSNPGILNLEKGVVTQKLHWNDVDNFNF